MTFPDPLYNSMDFNSAYPYSLGPNPFDGCKGYEGAEIAAPFTNNYPEEPSWGSRSIPRRSPLGYAYDVILPPKMEDALPEELR